VDLGHARLRSGEGPCGARGVELVVGVQEDDEVTGGRGEALFSAAAWPPFSRRTIVVRASNPAITSSDPSVEPSSTTTTSSEGTSRCASADSIARPTNCA
jgi:hypothetical protein